VGLPAHPVWQYAALDQAARVYESVGQPARAAALHDLAARAWPAAAQPPEKPVATAGAVR
jgi:hypothetical protein